MRSSIYNSFTRINFITAMLLLAGGCAVGPNFKKPAPPNVSGYTPGPFPSSTTATEVAGGTAQTFVAGADISGDWWKLFHSQALNDLISQALTNNPDLKSAQAALTQARETMLAGRGV